MGERGYRAGSYIVGRGLLAGCRLVSMLDERDAYPRRRARDRRLD